MQAGSFDVAGDELGGLIGIASLDVRDEFAMITDDLRSSRQGEIEPAADRTKHLAVLPPQLSSVSIVVSLIDQGVEFGVEVAVLDLVDEVVGLDLALDPFQFGDIGFSRHPDKPARQSRLDQNTDLVDVANKIPIDRPHARAAVAGEDNEAFAAQELKYLPNRCRRTAMALCKIGDDQALIGFKPARNNVLANDLVEQRRGIG